MSQHLFSSMNTYNNKAAKNYMKTTAYHETYFMAVQIKVHNFACFVSVANSIT